MAVGRWKMFDVPLFASRTCHYLHPPSRRLVMDKSAAGVSSSNNAPSPGNFDYLNKKMRKVVIHAPGSYEQLKIEEHPIPRPGPGEVLIEVHAYDCCVRMGVYESQKKYVGWPCTPGFEVAGVVVDIGPNKPDLILADGQKKSPVNIGSRVLGGARFGCYSNYIVTSLSLVWELPKGMSMIDGAGFTAAYLTAGYAMWELSHPRPGQTMLVHSAAGGVGSCLVQLGKAARCQVIGVVGASHKVELVKKLGADHVIDKSKQDLWKEVERIFPNGVHHIYDANGVGTLQQSFEHLGVPGKLVVYGFHTMLPRTGGSLNMFNFPKLAYDWYNTPSFDPLKMTGANRSVLAFNLSYMFEEFVYFQEIAEKLIGLYVEGKITAIPAITFSFDQVAEAHKTIESAQTTGKLVITTDHYKEEERK